MGNIKSQNSRGFTIIELMVTIAILAIVLTFAIPGFEGLKQSYQLKSAVSSVFSAIGWARAQAIRLQTPVIVVPNAAKGWSGGWKICKDPDSTGVCQDSETIKVEPALGGAVSNSGASVKVQINPSGMITTSASIGTFEVGQKKREIYIEMNRIKERVSL